VTLDEASPGEALTVEATHAPSPPVGRRLAELGIRTGTVLEILTRTSGHGAILAIGDDRIAVSRSILRSIHVRGDRL
jgi:Fe2+ transport system protein FeoA